MKTTLFLIRLLLIGSTIVFMNTLLHTGTELPKMEIHFLEEYFFGTDGVSSSIRRNIPASVDYLTNFVITWLPAVTGKEFAGLRRIALNAACPGQRGGVHCDDESDTSLWTVLYYITDSSGDTLIYDGDDVIHSCKYKQGKFVAFPSTYVHNAEAPESGWRMSLAFGIQVQ